MLKSKAPRTAKLRTRLTSLALVLAVAAVLAHPKRAHGHAGEDYPNDDLGVIPDGTVGLLPDNETTPNLDGQIGPLLPMHAMSVHNTLLWKFDKPAPTMLMFHRHSAYRADEVSNPDVIRFLIENPDPVSLKNALADPANQLNTSFRRSFVQFCYGGYNIIHDVSQSVPTRIRIDQDLELAQLWDMNHPDAFKYDTKSPKYSSAQLNNDDAELNIYAFRDMGFSKGLAYDMYCPGFSTLADGRVVFMGGHDMNSQNGNYRTQIFDPDIEKWADRPTSCMRAQYGADPNDPFLEKKYKAEVDRLKAEAAANNQTLTDADILREMSDFFLPVGNSIIGDCNPHLVDPGSYSTTYPEIRLNSDGGTVTHPENLTSDMKYARWYPTSIALPNNQIYIYAGWDRDEKFAPEWPTTADPTNSTTRALRNFKAAKAADPTKYPGYKPEFDFAGELRNSGDGTFLGSTYRQPVPEVYDAKTDTTYALENARLLHFDWYPNGTVVQTGPGRNDWKVAVLDGEIYENVPGGYKPTTGAINETFPNGVQSRYFTKTWLVDVQGAMKDPKRNDPTAGAKVSDTQAGKFVTYLDKSFSNHTPFSGNANIIELDKLGKVVSHKLTHFGGAVVDRVQGQSNLSDTAEQIDFANLMKRPSKKTPVIEAPKWKVLPGKLYQPGRQQYATPTPDGKIVILGGNGGTLPGIEAWSLHLQLCDPETGTVEKLAKSLVPRDEHGIIQLMPDATVYLGGQNRNGLIRVGDAAAPAGDSDLGVPSAQMYRPPYLFDANQNPADRPMIAKAPAIVDYGKPFKTTVYSTKKIKSVSLFRTGSMSHALNTDHRLVKVPFKQSGTNITVFPPKLPGTAVPGNYMLFVIDEDGVPSKAAKFTLGRDVEKRVKALKKAGLLTMN